MSRKQYEELLLERPELKLIPYRSLCTDGRELVRKSKKEKIVAEAAAWILTGEKLYNHALWDVPF